MSDFQEIRKLREKEKVQRELEERQRIEDLKKRQHAEKEEKLERAKKKKEHAKIASSLNVMVLSVLSDFGKAAWGSNPVWPWSKPLYSVKSSDFNSGLWFVSNQKIGEHFSITLAFTNIHFDVSTSFQYNNTDQGYSESWDITIHTASIEKQALSQAIQELYFFTKEKKKFIFSLNREWTDGKFDIHYIQIYNDSYTGNG